MKLKLYRQVTCITHSPGDERGCGDVSPKGHRKGCRLCFAKADGCCCRPVRVGKGRSSPFPTPRQKATTWGHLFLIRGRYNGGCVLLCDKV